jgi:hypothetical protein
VVEGKVCSKCKEYKLAEFFGKASKHSTGLRPECTPCRRLVDARTPKRNRWPEQREWRKKNRDKYLATVHRYKKKNADKVAAFIATYRATRLKATPKWLTAEDRKKILEIYTLARKLTRETGIIHEVDHIIPLQGKTVCGLHVPSNLQILTKEENSRKRNNFEE